MLFRGQDVECGCWKVRELWLIVFRSSRADPCKQPYVGQASLSCCSRKSKVQTGG